MFRNSRKRRFSRLTAAALALFIVTGWSSAAAPTFSGKTYHAPRFFRAHNGVEHLSQGAARLAPLTEAEVAALGLPSRSALSTSQQQQSFASQAFQRTWERTDKPVASGQTKRSWYWGPAPNSGGVQEGYAEGANGSRLVQYFDKSRMEINNPNGDPNNPFYVTNGLLTVELISGKMQTGNAAYIDRWPADIPLASDPDDPGAPTYMSFRNVSNTTLGDHPANANTGQPATATITRDGTVGSDPTKASYPDSNFIYYDPATKHNIPKAIWDFLNQSGPVYNPATGQTANARLSEFWFYATGLPISEPYWARVKIAGQQQDVLIQAFERRVVTYMPNGVPGFKVQMSNIGQHYYDWRYKDAGKPAGWGVPTATPTQRVVPTATQPPVPPTNTPNPGADCTGIPSGQNMIVTPNCGPGGTDFIFEGSGFQPGENVGIYITAPDQAVYGAPFQEPADSEGKVTGIGLYSDPDFPAGLWAITMEGTVTHNRAIGYFKIIDPNAGQPTPTPGSSNTCADVPASQNMQITPSNCERAGTRFWFDGRGFQPGEMVGVYVTDPNQRVFGAPFQITADGSGIAGPVSLTTDPTFPLGVWALTMEGTSSHARAIGYFKLLSP